MLKVSRWTLALSKYPPHCTPAFMFPQVSRDKKKPDSFRWHYFNSFFSFMWIVVITIILCEAQHPLSLVIDTLATWEQAKADYYSAPEFQPFSASALISDLRVAVASMKIRPNKLPLLLLSPLRLNATVWLLTVSRNSRSRSSDARWQQFQQLWFLLKLPLFFLWPLHPPSPPQFLFVQVICTWSMQNAWKHFVVVIICAEKISVLALQKWTQSVLQRESWEQYLLRHSLLPEISIYATSVEPKLACCRDSSLTTVIACKNKDFTMTIYVAEIVMYFAAGFLLVGHCSHCGP